MHALVTGGGGFLGLYLVEQLVARGDRVRVLCRGSYPRLAELNVECLSGDIRDASAVEVACRGVDAVFHTAAVSGIWGPWSYYHGINTMGTLNVLSACRKQGVARLIHTSSPSVIYDGQDHRNANESLPYPSRYLCHYPHSKALAERAVLEANDGDRLATVALRPHLIWGPRDNHLIPRLVARAKMGRLVRVGDGRNLISMAYVENVAAAHLQAADCLNATSPIAGRAYFINEPEPVSLWAWIDELLSLAGLPRVRKRIPASVAYAAGATLEGLYRVLGKTTEPPMTRFLAQQLAGSHYYSIDGARRDFEYRPIVDVAEGMRRMEPELRRLAQNV
ncbi:MAG: NAD-dependent epimerase/dehydratase family protein [Planctomycetota bacterium]|nr:NAD-dependent epimerase/dehydratase family protein [Planctomycetota bacterium]